MERRLAAIMAADVVGFSRLMGDDEAGTLERLKALRRELVEPGITARKGRIVKLMGDGLLAEFPSVVEAVQCAVDIQAQMGVREKDIPDEQRIMLRIGINLGDIIVEGTDIYGDGVNIAARLEALAAPGGVCISGPAFDAVDGKLDMAFEDMGLKEVKNIARPVRVYAIGTGVGAPREEKAAAAPLSDRPSIAVLPFTNMSGDAEQEYFADGVVEDIITELSRNKWLFVIARNSSFAYKGRAVDIKQVGRELGVRYVLEGSVRKAGERVRITGQLIDAASGAHLWADRFDGELADIFDLQDRVTRSVVAAIAPKVEQAEFERSKRKPTGSLDAYDFYLRGMAAFHRFTKAANEEALEQFARAYALDPDYAAAYGMAARCYVQRMGFGWVEDRARERADALALARQAADLGRDDAVALAGAGFAQAMFGAPKDGDAIMDRSLALNPNLAWTWHISGLAKALCGHAEAAVERSSHAMSLSPQDPQIFGMLGVEALGHYLAGRYDDALARAEAAEREKPDFFLAAIVATASAAQSGREGETKAALERLRRVNPELRASNVGEWFTFERREDLEHLVAGLRAAGLPD